MILKCIFFLHEEWFLQNTSVFRVRIHFILVGAVLKRQTLCHGYKRRSICEANLNPASRCKIRNANCFCGTQSKIPALRFGSKHQIEFNVILVNPLIFRMQNISASVRFNFGYLHADRARFRFYLLHPNSFCCRKQLTIIFLWEDAWSNNKTLYAIVFWEVGVGLPLISKVKYSLA